MPQFDSSKCLQCCGFIKLTLDVLSVLLHTSALKDTEQKHRTGIFYFQKQCISTIRKVINFLLDLYDSYFVHFLTKKKSFNSLPNGRVLDMSKFQASLDFKKKKVFFRRRRVKAFLGEEKCHQHFLLYPQCFQKPSSFRSMKFSIVL